MEVMTAYRFRRAPSPPDRRPPRRGGGSSPSPYTCAASAAGRAAGPAGARRGLVRSARALATAALLALAGALALPATAQAQTATTLVSNIGQSTNTNETSATYSQRFTTGSNAGGYTLTGVDIVSGGTKGFTAKVCGVDSSGYPTSTCTDLMPPGAFAAGTLSFTPLADATLMQDTTYAVVASPTGSLMDVGRTSEDGEDMGFVAPWSIANEHDFLTTTVGATWQTDSFGGGRSMLIAIKGTAVLPLPVLSVADAAAVTEGSPATFTVTLTPASTKEVTVQYSVGAAPPDQTATTEDFTFDEQTLTFAPGETMKTVTVATTDDALDEADEETFHVNLSHQTNATFDFESSSYLSIGTINDNDAPPTLSAADVSAEEGDGLTFTVALSAESGRDVTVAWAAAYQDALGDTAEENTDFTPASGTLTFTGRHSVYNEFGGFSFFATGETSKTFTVSTTEDSLDEANETFTVTLSNPTNAGISDATAKGTITNDDPPAITGVEIASTPVLTSSGASTPDTYGLGETIEISVTFSAAVAATADTDFVLSVSGAKRAALLRGSGTQTLVFGYAVQAGDEDDNGIWIGDQDRTLVGDRRGNPQNGAITSVASGLAVALVHSSIGTQSDHKVDGSRSIVSVAVSSTPMLETDTYGGRETIRFTVTFNAAVNIGGDPVFRFSLGNTGQGRNVDAAYESGTGTTALVFGYTVQAGDSDDNGIWIGDQDQTLVGSHQSGTITIVATGTAAGLAHAELGAQSGHKVDGSRTTSNNPPTFDGTVTTREVPENSAADTEVSDPVTATDDDDDTLTYTLEGTDAASFTIDSGTGQIKTVASVDYNHEAAKNTYQVTVKADDGFGGTDTIDVTINVTDVNEQSAKPAKPTLAKVTGSSTSLTATWTEPDLDGGPAITGYKLEYREGTTGTWMNFPHSGTAVTTTITGLTADTEYQVQVHAENGETPSDWSDPSDAVGTNRVNTAPSFTSPAAFSAEENAEAAGTVEAEDGDTGDGVTDYAITGGVDQALFEIGATDGALSFKTAPNFEDPQDQGAANTYEVTVQATSGAGEREKTATQTIAVTVTDAAEKPGKPAKPTLEAISGSTTSLTATWTKPDLNGGPEITGYDVQYRQRPSGAWTNVPHAGMAVTTTITGLTADMSYQVRVRAKNEELDSDWSDPSDAEKTTAGPPVVARALVTSGSAGRAVRANFDQDLDQVSSSGLRPAFSITADGAALAISRIGRVVQSDHSIDIVLSSPGQIYRGQTVVLSYDRSAAGDRALANADGTEVEDFTTGSGGVPAVVNGSTANDPSGNNAPSITSQTAFNAAENARAAGTVEASDSDTEDNIEGYAITGGEDQALFSIDSTSGALTFDTAPDFEDPQDQGADNTYEVTVQATSGTGTREKTATQTIAVTVTNADEGQSGTVTVDDTSPMVGDELTASAANVADPDGLPDPFAPAWRWYRTPAAGSETEIPGAASDTYTVVEADLGATLTAKASWTDKGGFPNTLASAPTSAVADSGTLPTLSVADAEGTEGGNVTFTAMLSATATADVTATWTASIESGDTAVLADLGTTTTGPVMVTAGQTTGTFMVPTAPDATSEGNETFTVTLSGVSSNAQLAADATATGTIVDDDQPTMGFSVDSDFIAEERGKVEFDVVLDKASTVPITVDWETRAGSAEVDVDYTAASGTLTFAPGDTKKTITVALIDDDLLEDLDQFTVHLSGTDDALVTLGRSSTIAKIIDQDRATITVAEETTVDEDAGTVTLTLTASASSTAAYMIDYATEDGTAEAGTDYTAASGQVTFPAAETEQTITITVLDDAADEDREDFKVRLSNATDLRIDLPAGPARVLIDDDDDPPTVTVADAAATEGDKAEFVVTLSAVSGRDVEVDYATSVATGDDATSGTDFTAASGTLTIAAADNTATGTIEVQTTEDDASESAETFTLTISNPDNATLGTPSAATGTIDNRATAPTITAVAVTSVPVLETDTYGAGETIRFTVTFSAAVDVTGDPHFAFSLLNGEDSAPYESGSGTRALVFGYTVVSSDEDDDGIFLFDGSDFTNRDGAVTLDSDDAITAAGSTTDADLAHTGRGTQSGHKVDGSRSIVSVAVSSTPMLETDTYGAGETIRFTVTFSAAVNIGGSPVFRFSLGNLGVGRNVDAAYESGTGTTALVFGYTVVSSDEDDDGIWIGDQARTLVGNHQNGTITIVATSEEAGLAHAELGLLSGHKVDGSRTTGNNPPVFTSSASLSVKENTANATVVAVDNDTDDDITGYALTGGTDQTFFSEITSAGVLSFDEAPNFEDAEDQGADNTYVVEVQATSGTGTREMTATQTITVTVTDADEKSAKPAKPTLAKVTGSSTTLTATWTKPDLNGGPDIAGYAVQYRERPTGTWTAFAHTGTTVTTTITGLTADTSYQVQVRAKNGETDSDWSDASDAVSTNAEMSTPTCTLNTGDIWCGVLTVGSNSAGSRNGYHSGQYGQLSDTKFDLSSTEYTVESVRWVTATGQSKDLILDLDGLPAEDVLNAWYLQVDANKYQIANAQWSTTGDQIEFTNAYGPPRTPPALNTAITVRLTTSSTGALSVGAELSALTVNDGNADLTLSPAFDAGTYAYTTAVASGVETVTITATPADRGSVYYEVGSTRLVDADAMTSGFQVTLELGVNTIFVIVVSEDGGYFEPYTVTVTRPGAVDTPTDFTATVGDTQVTLAWDAPASDSGVTGHEYRFKEGTGAYGDWVQIADSGVGGANEAGFTVTGLTNDRVHVFQLRAASTGGYSAPATSAEVTPAVADDFPADTTTSGVVAVGGSATGVIGSAVDLDWFRVMLAAGKTYQIDMEGSETGRGDLDDPYLWAIHDGVGALVLDLTLDPGIDDGGQGFNSRATFTPSAAGAYYVAVAGSGSSTGGYTLFVREVMPADATLSALMVNDGSSDLTLTPAFASGTYAYTVSVANSVDEVTVTPTTNQTAATFAWLDADDNALDDADTSTGHQVALAVGANVFKVKVTSQDGTAMQTYTVTVTRAAEMTPDDPPDDSGNVSEPDGEDLPANPTTTGQVEVGSSVTGNIGSFADRDYFRVVLEAGTRYQIDLEGAPTGRGTLADPALTLYDESEDNLLDDVNSGIGGNSRGIFTPTTAGTYYLRVADFDETDTGTYTLSVIVLGANGASEADTDFPATTATTGRVEVGASATGNIENLDDAYDWFRVDLEAGKTYQFDLEGVDTSRGMLDDPYLGLFDGSGTSLFDDDDDGTGLNSRITHTPATGGTYYLGAARAGTSAGTYTLSVRDIPSVTLSIADAEGAEDEGVEFTVTLSAVAATDVTATWTASIETGDTASTADLATTKTGTVTVDDGETTAKFTVPVNDDNTDEPDQTFTVTLSNPSPTSLAQLAADPTARGTITDDDNLPLLAIGGGGASEASTQALSVSLTPASGREVMVTWTATIESHDTAEAADFTDLSTATGTVTIPAGQSSILLFVRGVIDDSLDEDDESFTVTLSSPVNATLSTTHTVGRVTIQDDDDPPTVTVADAAATEGDKVEFVVTLSAVSGRDVTVDYATSVATGDDATSGTDFTAASSTLTIEEGDETGTIEVQTTEDSTEEEDETFTLTISDPANATLGTKTAARGTIKDDDGTLTPTNCTLNTGDVWCGEVTVGAETNTGGATTGHGFSSITGDSFGTLTDNSGDQTFTYGTQTYLVNRVVAGAGTFAGELNFRVRRAVPEGFLLDDDHVAKLALHVAGSSNPFAFKVATSSTSVGYIWRNSGLDWSSATPVTVRLRELPDAPTGFEAAVGNAQVGLTWDAPASGANITRHEFRQKTGGGSYPTTWTAIATSAPGGTNEASFTVTGLTNEIAHTFELRAVNDSGGGAADESDEVTPTPGICGRTAKIQEVILVELADVTDCAAVTVADLASITTFGVNGFGTFDQGITSLQAGDFAGLTGLTLLKLNRNQLTSLPEGIFSGLTAITEISLNENQLTSLPEGTFAGLPNLLSISLSGNNFTQIPGGELSGVTTLTYLELTANKITELPAGLFTSLTALDQLYLGGNDLETLDAGLFSGLSALEVLNLNGNELESLPDGLLSGLSALESLELKGNDLNSLDAGVFSGLSALEVLKLSGNELESLPDGLLSGLSALETLELHGNTVDPLPLTVTVEKVGTDQARAEVLAGAPLAVAFKATVANGSLAGGATTLGVAAGSVEGTPVTVTRTSGTTESVTVDIDLSTQPTLPTNHSGYEFVKATSGLPAEILPAVGMTPTIDDVDITSTPVLETDTYGAGEKIRLTVEFSEAVTVTGQPHIEFSLGNMSDTRRVKALYESGSGADELVFAYTVVSSDEDNNGIFTHPDALMVESGESIVSAGGVNADLDHAGDGTDSGHKVDGSRSIVSVAVSSTPMLETDTYGAGETIRFKVTFNVAVDVTGDPVLAFALGNQDDVRDVDAAHESGTGTTALVFGYTVASTDEDNNGIYLKDEQDFNTPDGPVRLDSDDTIRFAGTSTDVPLYWQGRGTQSGHKVDGSLTSSNSAPSFTSSATFDAAENQTSAGTVEAEDSDTEDNIEGYEIAGGADSDFFSEVTSAGVLTFNEAPNFEDPQDQDGDNTYEVTVQATSGTGTREMTATQTITVTVTDAGGEAPGKPDAPTVSAASATSLTATWLAPANAGPAIDDYDVQYREGATGDWSNGGHTGAATTATLSGLSENTSYQVQVRATNDEGTGSWSDSGSGATNAETPDAPTITAVAVTSTPQLETDTYGEDETIEVSVTFSEAVNATSDTDFVLSVAGDKRAPLVRGSGTTTLAFGYTVASSDEDDNGIWIGDQDRTLAGDRDGNPQNGAIASAATSAAADLAHDALGTLSGHKVDGSRTPTPDDDPLNNDPVFTEGDSATREVANGSSPATKIGQPVTATDADNDELVYDLEGDDRSLFIITENSAQILTWPVPGVVDYSGRNSYQVTVKARDGKGGSDAIDVTINFTDSDDEDDGPPEDDDEDDGPPEDDDEDDGPPEENDDEDDGPPEDDDEDDGPPEENDDGPPETPTTPVAPPVPHTTTPARLRIRALDADADSMSLHMSWRAPEANAAAVTGYRFRVFEGPATRRVWPPVVDWTPVPEPLYEQNGRYEHTVRLGVASAYTVWLRAALTNGFSDHAQADIFYFHPVGAESEERPERVALIGNYPNPFNPSTEIVYELPGPGPVRLVVYDMIGREVQVLADAHRTAGRHTARFDAEGLPTGTYAYTLTAGSVAITRVMVLVR